MFYNVEPTRFQIKICLIYRATDGEKAGNNENDLHDDDDDDDDADLQFFFQLP